MIKHLVYRVKSDVIFDLLIRPAPLVALCMLVVIVVATIGAPLLSPQDPFDVAALDLLNSHLPPAFSNGGSWSFPLGTDKQGRDVLSAILFGARISLVVGLSAVAVSTLIGVAVGVCAGYFGGWVDAMLMRLAEIQFAFPPLLLALLLNGFLRALLGSDTFTQVAIPALVLAIGLAGWVPFARVVRATTMVERSKDYILACKITNYRTMYVIRRHVVPNVLGPVLVLAMTQVAVAVMYEATLSFLGLGTPLTTPSLGALIQSGSQYLFSGIWWVVVFPGSTLLVVLVSLTVFGDWLRDALNPRLN